MANFLSITKEDNEQFSFILNSDTATEIINTRNDLLTIGNICHFKTSEGANLIKEQNILYSNVSLFNGVTPVSAPTSVRDLFDKLTALEFFDWIKDGSGSGVNRFDELADTFTYLGKAGQFVIVDDNEIQLTTRAFTPVERFTDLIDTPNALIPNKIPKVNNEGTLIDWVDAVPFSAELPLFIEDAEIKIQKASASTDGYLSAEDFNNLIKVPKIQFTADGITDVFDIGVNATIVAVFWNSALLNDLDWTQTGTTFTTTFTPDAGSIIKPI